MNTAILHSQTAERLAELQAHPPHALTIIGANGIGKMTIATVLASQILGSSEAKVLNVPAVKVLKPTKERSISVDAVRELEHFMSLKMVGSSWRVAIIEDAQYLTQEAQNALLKTLEEPPADTLIILTSSSEQLLLPTIRSRTQSFHVQRPAVADLETHFISQGYSKAAIQQAILMSGGLPGLMHALLDDDATHPLVAAAQIARQILQLSTFERLAMVDSLSKQRDAALEVLGILQQMAHLALQQAAQKSARQAAPWRRILEASYSATEALLQNTQSKLVLTDLMLSI